MSLLKAPWDPLGPHSHSQVAMGSRGHYFGWVSLPPYVALVWDLGHMGGADMVIQVGPGSHGWEPELTLQKYQEVAVQLGLLKGGHNSRPEGHRLVGPLVFQAR